MTGGTRIALITLLLAFVAGASGCGGVAKVVAKGGSKVADNLSGQADQALKAADEGSQGVARGDSEIVGEADVIGQAADEIAAAAVVGKRLTSRQWAQGVAQGLQRNTTVIRKHGYRLERISEAVASGDLGRGRGSLADEIGRLQQAKAALREDVMIQRSPDSTTALLELSTGVRIVIADLVDQRVLRQFVRATRAFPNLRVVGRCARDEVIIVAQASTLNVQREDDDLGVDSGGAFVDYLTERRARCG